MTGWFRSWHGAPTDTKWLGIARKADVAPGIVAAIAWALMDRASQAKDRGSIEGYDADGLACFFGCEPDHVDAIVQAMEDKGIISNGFFTAWEKRQPKREDSSTQRVKAHRKRTKQQAKRDVTRCNAPDTGTDTELDTVSSDEETVVNGNAADPPERLPVQQAFEHYNIAAKEFGLPIAEKLTAERRRKLRVRLKEHGLEGWDRALCEIEKSDFLSGEGGRGWRANLDFMLRPSNFNKLIEGGYTDAPS